MSDNKIFIYPLWLRVWHVFNALLCLILIVTGMSMQYSSQDSPLIAFKIAVRWHDVAGVILFVNYISFIIGNSYSTNGNHYKVVFKGLIQRFIVQFKFYTGGLFKGETEPYPIIKERKFNPLQQTTYVLVMYLFLPLILISGCLMFFPEKVVGNIFNVHAFLLVDIVHVMTGFMISVFMIVHVYLSTISHDNKILTRFRSIINGWHVE